MGVETNDPFNILPPTLSANLDALWLTHRGTGSPALDVVTQLPLRDMFTALQVANAFPALPTNATAAQIVAWLTAIGLASPVPPSPPVVAWTPASMTNLTEWWKPSPDTTKQDAALSISGAVGQKVRVLLDKRSGRNVSQLLQGDQPTLVQVGGNYGVQFVANRGLTSTVVPARTDFECVCVFSWPYVMTTTGAQQSALYGREVGASLGSRINAAIQNNSVGRILGFTYTSAGGAAALYPGTPPPAANTLGVFRCRYQWAGGNSTVTGSTTTFTSGTSVVATTLTSEGDGEWRLGTASDSTDSTTGGLTLFECFRTNGPISSGDATQLTTYLNTTYGTTY